MSGPFIELRQAIQLWVVVEHEVDLASRSFIRNVLQTRLVLLGYDRLVLDEVLEGYVVGCIGDNDRGLDEGPIGKLNSCDLATFALSHYLIH